MVKLTYGQLRSPVFARALLRLANCASLKSPQVAYNAAKINKRAEEEFELSNKLYEAIYTEYAARDENGAFIPREGTQGTWVARDDVKIECDEKISEFNAISFEIDRPALNLADLGAVGLSPAEINALGPIIFLEES